MSSIETFLGTPPPETQPPLPEPQSLLGQHLHHLSASSLGMVLRCPRQFYRRYILGEKQRPGESIVIGSFFHETLDWNYKTKIASHTDQPLSDAVQFMQDVAVPKVIEEEGGVENILWDSDLDTARSDSERIMSAYYRSVVPRIQPVATEERFEMFFPGVEVPIIGFVDVERGKTDMDIEGTSRCPSHHRYQDGQAGHAQGQTVLAASGPPVRAGPPLPVEYHSVSRAKTPTIVTGLESADMVVDIPTDAQARNMERTVKAAPTTSSTSSVPTASSRSGPL